MHGTRYAIQGGTAHLYTAMHNSHNLKYERSAMVDTQIVMQDVVVVSQSQVSAKLEGEQVILSLEDGIYYGLNPVGACVWALIQEPKTVREIADTLLAEFEVQPDQCIRELVELLEELKSKSLVEVKHEPIG
jgi:hypothetical protein